MSDLPLIQMSGLPAESSVLLPAVPSEIDARWIVRTGHRRSDGGIHSKRLRATYDLVRVVIDGFDFDADFDQESVLLWSHVGSGRRFSFLDHEDWLDNNCGAFVFVAADASAGATSIRVFGGSGGPPDYWPGLGGDGTRHLVIDRLGFGGSNPDEVERQYVLLGAGPHLDVGGTVYEIQLDSELQFDIAWSDGYLLHSRYAFPDCLAVQEEPPYRLMPGRWGRFDLSFVTHVGGGGL